MYFVTNKLLYILCNSLLTVMIAASFSVQAGNTENNQIQRGGLVYKRFCSLCHGVNLKGQKNWRIRKDNGKLPAPPHDETGHTWHHADDLLFGIIKKGLVPPYAPKTTKPICPPGEILSAMKTSAQSLLTLKVAGPGKREKYRLKSMMKPYNSTVNRR